MTHRYIRVYGQVQHVGYRGWAVQKATELGLDGSVKNIEDGTVEIFISGPNDKVDKFTQACQIGPERAEVDGIHTRDKDWAYRGEPGFINLGGKLQYPNTLPCSLPSQDPAFDCK